MDLLGEALVLTQPLDKGGGGATERALHAVNAGLELSRYTPEMGAPLARKRSLTSSLVPPVPCVPFLQVVLEGFFQFGFLLS